MHEHEAIYSQSVIEMYTVANEYCIFIEKAANYNKTDVCIYLSRVLPLLYLKGALIPGVEVEFPEANERYVTEEQWQDIFNKLRVLFGADDEFVFCDSNSSDFEIEKRSLAEHLADIYQDMKDFVLLFSKEIHAARENAVSEISQLFKSHWGIRLLMCQMHLHTLLHPHNEEDEIN